MKRPQSLFIASLFISLFISISAFAGEKVDPFIGMFGPASSGVKAMAISHSRIEVFIKTNDIEATKEAVAAQGGAVKIAAGNVLTASIPAGSVEAIAQREEVVFIEGAKPVTSQNDLATSEINANEVNEGVELPQAFTGKNAIVGIVDTGIDYDHPDFTDADGNSRILFVWDQQGSGAGPSEISGSYGVECDSSDLARGTCPVSDETGHGTHITGTAAGRHSTYGGVAPDASIIVVRYKAELELNDGYANPIFSTTICEGAYYVFKKAEKLGMPAVVNLSLGTHIGAHDGTSLFEECLDNLVAGSKGRAIVVAAGNENSDDDRFTGLHAGYDVEGNNATNFVARSFAAGRIFYLDIWGRAGSDLDIGLQINESTKTIGSSGYVAPGDSKSGSFLGGKVRYEINAEETSSPLNGKPHVGIMITFSDSVDSPGRYSFDLLVSGSGHFDAWLYPDKPATIVNFTELSGRRGGLEFVPGDRTMSVAIPATAKNVIGVAAYATRSRWDKGAGCCQVAYSVGDILDFSSVGPSADPSFTGQKPEIAAPGAMIASARSRSAVIDDLLIMSDGYHALMAGTSMAAPFVAGTAALLFSANPDYTFEDVEKYIVESAYVDTYVGSAPNDRWGYGKLDVLATVEAALGGGASGSASLNPDVSLPDSGGASCQIAAFQTAQGPAVYLLMLGLGMSLILIRRRS